MNENKKINFAGNIVPSKIKDPFQQNLNRLSRNVTNIAKIKEENIYFKLVFNQSQDLLNETIGLFIKEKKPYLQQQSPRINSFMFSNKNVSDLCQKFIQVTSLYCFIISSYIKTNNYLNARNIFDSFFTEFKDIFVIFCNRIEKNYPNRGGANTIKAFYPKMILQILRALACLIHLSEKLNKQMSHAFFFNLYFKFITIIKNKVDTFCTPRSENKQKENSFFIHSLSLGAYYFIWKITPLHTAICLLNKIVDINNETHEQEKTEKELYNQYIIYHNITLLYMTNDQDDNAITSLNRAVIICSFLNEFSNGMDSKLKEINQMLITIYLLLIEVLIDKKEYYSALQYVKKTIPFVDKYNNENNEHKRVLDTFLKQINASMTIVNNKQQNMNDKIKEYKMMLIDPNEDLKSRLNFTFEVEEIEKLCLFLSSLSMHQIKLLNDTQPKMSKRISLPIGFSNQFTDCLSFSQRMSLLNIKILLLSRFVILKDPEKPITLQNLNYELFSLREKQMITIKSKKSIQVKSKSPTKSIVKNKELDNFLALFNDKKFVNQNRELLVYCYKTMNNEFLKEAIRNPEKMKKMVLFCKNEFKEQLDSERGFSTSRTRDSNDLFNRGLSMTERKENYRNDPNNCSDNYIHNNNDDDDDDLEIDKDAIDYNN